MLKDTISLADAFQRLPKEIKRKQIQFNGRTTLNSMIRELKLGSIKLEHMIWK